MNILNTNSLFGQKFFRFSDLQPLNTERYFSCLNLMKPLFKREDFKNSTPGFYINYITNTEGGNSVRLTYFTDNEIETNKAIKSFLNGNNNIALFQTQDSYESGQGNIAGGYGGEDLRFRNFLSTYTKIGLDLLGYDILYARRLVVEYRLTYSTQKISSKPLFEPAFSRSNFFKQLSTIQIEQLWKDLDYWYPINNGFVADWGHFLVNMLLPGDFTDFQDLVRFFVQPNSIGPITGPLKTIMLRRFGLDD